MTQGNNKDSRYHPAVAHLREFEKQYLAIDAAFWKVVDGARTPAQIKAQPHIYASIPDVMDALYPRRALGREITAVASSHLDPYLNDEQRQFLAERGVAGVFSDICQMGAFRSSKYIVRMHPGLESELASSVVPKEIPSSVFKQLPAWGFFLEFGDAFKASQGKMVSAYHGVYVSVLDTGDGETALNITALPIGMAPPLGMRIAIDDKVNIESTIEDLTADIHRQRHDSEHLQDNRVGDFIGVLTRYVANVCLYLGSKEPEYSGPARPTFPKRIKSHYGMVLPEAKEPVSFELGARMGAALNAARAKAAQGITMTSDGTRPFTPHVRQPHWHHFWTGSRDPALASERRLVVHWLPRIPVKLDDVEDLQAVIRPVQPQVDEEFPEDDAEEAAAPRG